MAENAAAELTRQPTASSGTSGAVAGPGVARTSSAVSFNLQRRQSHAERINEILETARERAESMAAAGTASPRSPRTPGSPVLGRRPSASSQPLPIREDNNYSSADETTGIMSRSAADLNYQTVQIATSTRSNGPRSRKRSAQPQPQSDMEYRTQNGDNEHREKTSWWQAQFGRFQSIELENKGSVARDHLAIERTFLAWLRTSLAFASIGIAVTQLFRLNTSLVQDGKGGSNVETLRQMGKPLGATFLGISILILFLGYKRYFMSQEWVMKGKFPASRGTIMIVAFVAFAIMVASLVVVIVIHPSEEEL